LQVLNFPIINANLGSGVSILRLDSNGLYQRIGGSALGGATLIGLIRNVVKEGDFQKITSLIQDIQNSDLDTTLGQLLRLSEKSLDDSLIYSPMTKIDQYSLIFI
jgi:pantothenate kinase